MQYLAERLRQVANEPGPREIAAHLEAAGFSTTLVQKATEFFEASAAARFAPGMLLEEDWATRAIHLLNALENE